MLQLDYVRLTVTDKNSNKNYLTINNNKKIQQKQNQALNMYKYI